MAFLASWAHAGSICCHQPPRSSSSRCPAARAVCGGGGSVTPEPLQVQRWVPLQQEGHQQLVLLKKTSPHKSWRAAGGHLPPPAHHQQKPARASPSQLRCSSSALYAESQLQLPPSLLLLQLHPWPGCSGSIGATNTLRCGLELWGLQQLLVTNCHITGQAKLLLGPRTSGGHGVRT